MYDACVLRYFLPGGAVDHKEHLTTAAIRETKEEAGVDIDLTGVLAIEYTPSMDGITLVYFLMHTCLCVCVCRYPQL